MANCDESERYARFLTFSCFRRQPFLRSSTARAWLGQALTTACVAHDYALWAYVFMPEHVHLIVCPKNSPSDVSKLVQAIKQPVGRKALHASQRSTLSPQAWEPYLDIQPNGQVHFRFWQRGLGYDRSLFSPHEIREKVDYIHRNPVTRGLCDRPDAWEWSSFADYEGTRKGPIPVQFPDL